LTETLADLVGPSSHSALSWPDYRQSSRKCVRRRRQCV